MSSINPYNIDASSSNWEISGLDAIYIYVAITFLLLGYVIYMYIKERGMCSRDVSLEFNNRADITLSTPITTEFTPAPPYSEIDILDVPPSYESLFPKQDQT
ncbi:hypothetical protein NEAUS03_0484 [Nematocida ausubeli]|nr:hypothetical protein NEAUS03_0484 [Nematocida ausubeli]